MSPADYTNHNDLSAGGLLQCMKRCEIKSTYAVVTDFKEMSLMWGSTLQNRPVVYLILLEVGYFWLLIYPRNFSRSSTRANIECEKYEMNVNVRKLFHHWRKAERGNIHQFSSYCAAKCAEVVPPLTQSRAWEHSSVFKLLRCKHLLVQFPTMTDFLKLPSHPLSKQQRKYLQASFGVRGKSSFARTGKNFAKRTVA